MTLTEGRGEKNIDASSSDSIARPKSESANESKGIRPSFIGAS